MNNQSLLFKIDNLIEGVIINRPSKIIKTPYVADVIIKNSTKDIQDTFLAHSASLGCCGLSDKNSIILMAPKNKTYKDNKKHCEYTIYLSIIRDKTKETIVGIYPKLAEEIVENALKQNKIASLRNIKYYRRETKIYNEGKVDSRFDFSGIDENDIPFILEVKNVPLAVYEDLPLRELNKIDFSDRDPNSKVAYFPDGYRKKKGDVVSPRALKHINELSLISHESNTRCIICYVIQRDDINRFTISKLDPTYKQAVENAVQNGIEMLILCVKWTIDGECYLLNNNISYI